MKQHEGEVIPALEKGEAVVVELNTHKNGHEVKSETDKGLIKKNEHTIKKVKGLRI